MNAGGERRKAFISAAELCTITGGETEEIMRLFTGYTALLCFVLLVVKYPLRKLHMYKANAFLMKLHEAASALLLLVGIVHMFLGISALKNYSAIMGISGFSMLGMSFIIVAACHMTKDKVKKMNWHRWLSLAATLVVAVHISTYFLRALN